MESASVSTSGPASASQLGDRSLGFKIAFAFTASILLVILISAISYRSVLRLVKDSDQDVRTQKTLGTIGNLMIAFDEAEAGQRGYIISGNRQFLGPYTRSLARIAGNEAALRKLLSDDPPQMLRLHEVVSIGAARLEKLAEVLDEFSGQGGFERAQALIRAGFGRSDMERVRTITAEMSQQEQLVADQRAAARAKSADLTLAAVTSGGATALLIIVVFGFIIRNDVLARVRAEKRIVQLNKELDAHAHELESATLAKSAFLAHMSHEIRTPLTAITGYADLLLEPQQTESVRAQRISVIRRSGEHLLSLINGILDLSKIEAGAMSAEHIRVEPAQILNDISSIMRVRAAEKNLRLDFVIEGTIPRTIQSDPTKLKQILMNLMGNAVKFTGSGGVRVLVAMVESPDAPRLRIQIVDSGPGMSQEAIGRLFQPFTQLDASTTRRFGGTGLGLAISKRLVELLGGQLHVQSTPGQGSNFTVEVPTGSLKGVERVAGPLESMCASESAAGDQQPRPARIWGRLLLAEDNPDNQAMFAHHLRKAGADVVLVGDGQAACDAVAGADPPFDLILLDMQMPVLDGYAAASRLRHDGFKGPIIALTAHAMEEDRAKCVAAGCTDHLAKPIKRDVLIAAVARYLTGALQAEEAGDPKIQQLLGKFLRRLPEQVSRLRSSLAESRLLELDTLLHDLKGSGGTFGFSTITEAALRVESARAAGAEPAEISRLIDELVGVIRNVEDYPADLERNVAA